MRKKRDGFWKVKEELMFESVLRFSLKCKGKKLLTIQILNPIRTGGWTFFKGLGGPPPLM